MPPSVHYDLKPRLVRPVMVCAFAGWNDGGEAATTAARYLRDRWGAGRFASLDPEEFFDFQVNRPTVTLEDGVTRHLEWPACDFFQARVQDRDIVLFIGIEPNNRWRTFTEAILGVARELDVPLLVTLGAFLADVPHTRAAPVTAATGDLRWAGRLGIEPSRYEGPTGIVGVLHDASNRVAIPSVSLWGAAPHYLPSGTNPKVAMSLLRKLGAVLEIEIELGDLETATAVWERQVAQAIAGDENLAGYVERLEEAASEADLGQIPSGEQLAAELERFLKEHRGDGGTEG